MDERRWRDEAWLVQALTWVDDQLDRIAVRRTGMPEQRRVVRWSTVIRVDDLLALGVPDCRLPTLAAAYEALMEEIDAEQRFRGATPRVAELAEELATYGIAETLQHDDLHDGQVFVKNGRHLVIDWGDACVSHPFFTLSVDTRPFRDAYLAPYREVYDGDLDAACHVSPPRDVPRRIAVT